MIHSSDRFVVISGASSGGKSTMIDALAARGFATVPEAGRRLLREELAAGGAALPWADPTAFLRRMLDQSLADRAVAAAHDGWVFFDRSLIDAISGLEHRTGEPVLHALGMAHRYHHRVFLAPPWPDIYVMDAERRHGLAAATAEYHRLDRDYRLLGYDVCLLPKLPVEERVAFVLGELGIGPCPSRAGSGSSD